MTVPSPAEGDQKNKKQYRTNNTYTHTLGQQSTTVVTGWRERLPELRQEGGKIVTVQYFVRGGFVGHRSRVSSKHISLSSSG
ncbi:hypothetical protein TNCV_3581481 [Trichonephila clavipes]|nr:hypothetical protein TNCV_3581481 [Trichonephila clavipes]